MNASTQQDLGKLVLRIALGVLIGLHGISKLRHGLGGIEGMVTAHGLPAWVSYGVLAGELVAPLLLLLGWFSRIGALLIAINMLVAFALAHMSQLGQLNDQGGWSLELQGMYLAAAVALALLGPGRYAINQR